MWLDALEGHASHSTRHCYQHQIISDAVGGSDLEMGTVGKAIQVSKEIFIIRATQRCGGAQEALVSGEHSVKMQLLPLIFFNSAL